MDPALESEPRPDTPAAGNALVWMTLSLVAFGVFLVVVPGREPAGRTWLWVGIVLLVVGGISSTLAVRARWAYLREHRADGQDHRADGQDHRADGQDHRADGQEHRAD